MRMEEDDKLRSLFREMELRDPPMRFENRLMQQINARRSKKQKRIRVTSWLAIAGGVAAMCGLPLVVMWLTGMGKNGSLAKLPHIDPLFIVIAVSVMFLLVTDTVVRKYISEKK